jgi:hypothetical protein
MLIAWMPRRRRTTPTYPSDAGSQPAHQLHNAHNGPSLGSGTFGLARSTLPPVTGDSVRPAIGRGIREAIATETQTRPGRALPRAVARCRLRLPPPKRTRTGSSGVEPLPAHRRRLHRTTASDMHGLPRGPLGTAATRVTRERDRLLRLPAARTRGLRVRRGRRHVEVLRTVDGGRHVPDQRGARQVRAQPARYIPEPLALQLRQGERHLGLPAEPERARRRLRRGPLGLRP